MQQNEIQKSKITEIFVPESSKILELKATLKALRKFHQSVKKTELVFDNTSTTCNIFTLITKKELGIRNFHEHFALNWQHEPCNKGRDIAKNLKNLFITYDSQYANNQQITVDDWKINASLVIVQLIRLIDTLQYERLLESRAVYMEKRNEA